MSGGSSSRREQRFTALLVVAVGVLATVSVVRVVKPPRTRTPAPLDAPAGRVEDWRNLSTSGLLDGDPSAPIQVVEIIDLQCPACLRGHRTLQAMRTRFGGRIATTILHRPLSQHPHAESAALASICAYRAGAGGRFLEVAFREQDRFGTRAWGDLAREAGVRGVAAFAACLEDSSARRVLERHREVADALSVTATPTILLNGWRFDGVPAVSALTRLIESELALVPPGGVVKREVSTEKASADAPDALQRHFHAAARRGRIQYHGRHLAEATQLRLAQTPSWSTDDITAWYDLDLVDVDEVSELPGSSYLILSRRGSRITWIDRIGGQARAVGRPGGGPGEFRSVDGMARHGDSIAVVDVGNSRVTWIDTLGRARSSRRIEGLVGGVAGVAGVLSDGQVILHSAGFLPDVMPASGHSVARVFRGTVEGKLAPVMSVPDLRLTPVAATYRGRRTTLVDLIRLAPRAHVLAMDSVIVVASDSLLRFRLLSAKAEEQLVVDVAWPERRPTAKSTAANIARELEQLRNASLERSGDLFESERLVRSAPYAKVLPAISAMRLASDGTFWIVATTMPGERTWQALQFAPTGRLMSHLRWESDGTPVMFGSDEVVISYAQADGLTRLAAWRIERQR